MEKHKEDIIEDNARNTEKEEKNE
jgi:hypothetical protein